MRSTDASDYQATPRPIAAMAKDFAAGALVPLHRHPRSQLMFAASGVMSVTTADGVWVVPPHRGLWIPAGVEHAVRAVTALAMRTLYISPEAASTVSAKIAVLAISALLRELILEATTLPLVYDEEGRDGRVFALILDELHSLPALPLSLPMPADPRLSRLCERMRGTLATRWTVALAAAEAGVSSRTLARRFLRATGIGFGEWLRQARLLEALERLARGEKLTAIALDCGYDSPSAFAAMFRRRFGSAPSQYFGNERAGGSRPK
jgi:AraC-like DNA-binding protein/mannose-6-phosphate isomerase-like protein (cupin superfamily)